MKPHEAIYSLFEELYDSANAISKEQIHKAMVILMKYFDKDEHIALLDADMINVCHENEMYQEQRKIDLIKESIKEILNNI